MSYALAKWGLTLNYTIQTFKEPQQRSFWETLWEKEKIIALGSNLTPTSGVTSFTWDYIGKILEISLYLAIWPSPTKFCM